MKLFSKPGPASDASLDGDAPWDTPAVREPAPAGAHQRHYPADFPETEDDVPQVFEEPYVSPRARVGFRVRGAMRSTLGRVVVGSIAAILLGATATAAWAGHRFLLHDERFVIPSSVHIETSGNVHLTRAQLLSVFGEDVERNIFRVPLAQRRADLESLPWVQHATIMRLLPNTLRVSVTERTPVAFFREGSHIGLVDASGVLLDQLPIDAGDPHYSFPVLTGLTTAEPLSTRAARMEIYRKFVEDVDSSGEKVSDTLSEVDITSPEDVKVLPIDSRVLVHLGDEDFLKRYKLFRSHLNEWKQMYPQLKAADMRYDRDIVLEGATPNGTETVAANKQPATTAAATPAPAPLAKLPSPVAKPSAPIKAPEVAKAPAAKTPVKLTSLSKPEVRRPEAHRLKAAPPLAAAATRTAGKSASNEKMFAALAAAHKAQVEQSKQGRQ